MKPEEVQSLAFEAEGAYKHAVGPARGLDRAIKDAMRGFKEFERAAFPMDETAPIIKHVSQARKAFKMADGARETTRMAAKASDLVKQLNSAPSISVPLPNPVVLDSAQTARNTSDIADLLEAERVQMARWREQDRQLAAERRKRDRLLDLGVGILLVILTVALTLLFTQ